MIRRAAITRAAITRAAIRRAAFAVAAVAAVLLALAGCGAGSGAASDPTAAPGTAAAPGGTDPAAGGGGHGGHGGHGGGGDGDLELWAVQTGPLGVVVTDGTGALIYRSDRDAPTPPTSNCTGGCTSTWEPLKADLEKPPVLLGVDENTIGVMTRPDGSDQLTLAGWPLYRHIGTHTDPNLQANGTDGIWFAIRPDGSKAG